MTSSNTPAALRLAAFEHPDLVCLPGSQTLNLGGGANHRLDWLLEQMPWGSVGITPFQEPLKAFVTAKALLPLDLFNKTFLTNDKGLKGSLGIFPMLL